MHTFYCGSFKKYVKVEGGVHNSITKCYGGVGVSGNVVRSFFLTHGICFFNIVIDRKLLGGNNVLVT